MGARRITAVWGILVVPAVGCSLLLPFDQLGAEPTDASASDATAEGIAEVGPGGDAPTDAGTPGDGGPCVDGSARLRDDPYNCGSCGHACCSLVCSQGQCVGPLPASLEMDADNPGVLAMDPDDSTVYWGELEDGGARLMRYVKSTGETSVLAGGLTGSVGAIAVDAQYVYATTFDGTVTRVDKGDAGRQTIVGGLVGASALLGDPSHLYFTEVGTFSSPNGSIHISAKDGTNDVRVYPNVQDPEGLAILGSSFVYTQHTLNQVTLAPISGGDAGVTFSGETGARQIVAIGSDVYWADDETAHGVRHFTADAGPPKTIAAPVPFSVPEGLAVDAKYVYYTTYGAMSGAYYVGRDGSGSSLLSLDTRCPLHVAVGGDCVYWTALGNCPNDFTRATPGTGAVMRVDKPK